MCIAIFKQNLDNSYKFFDKQLPIIIIVRLNNDYNIVPTKNYF